MTASYLNQTFSNIQLALAQKMLTDNTIYSSCSISSIKGAFDVHGIEIRSEILNKRKLTSKLWA
jgi:hypothetical protein